MVPAPAVMLLNSVNQEGEPQGTAGIRLSPWQLPPNDANIPRQVIRKQAELQREKG